MATNVENLRAYQAAYRARNKAKLAAQAAARYRANSAERIAKAVAYQKEHVAEHGEAVKRYKQRNRRKVAKWNHSQWEHHREQLRADHRERYYPARADEAIAYQMARQGTPKVECRKALRAAVRRGEVVKPTSCSRCSREDAPRRIHAHHADYDKPFAVEWLCSICHAAEHRKVG